MAVREVAGPPPSAGLTQGVGDNAVLWVDGPNGRPALLYVVDRQAFTDAQLEELCAQAERWREALNQTSALRII